MLNELNIRDFVIIEQLSLQFGPGLNVFTGETGAGKSILIDAVSMLLGGRADSGLIRSGTDITTIEGIFCLSPIERSVIDPILERDELQNEEPGVLILCREIRRNGYNVCRINGRAIRLGVLEEVGRHLVDIHGQSEHLSLLLERAHLGFLDRYAGLAEERERLQAAVRQLRSIRRELDDLINNEREASQRSDLLRYQIDEIEAAHLKPNEDTTLVQERNRLANAEKLTAICQEALLLLSDGQDEQPPALDLVGESVRALANLARIDSQTEAQSQQAQDIEYQLDDLISALRDYQDQVEFSTTRLNEVEERLELIRRLQRKYGDTIEDVLAFGEQAGSELAKIENSEERIIELRAQEEELLRRVGQLGSALSSQRREAALRLSGIVEAELDELKMEEARFAVDLGWSEDEQGAIVKEPPQDSDLAPGRYAFDASGLDQVSFLIAPNVGEPLKPLAKVASGGETSRLMLALKTALSRADQIPTLIFDEIDQGIGGRIGGTVGEKLYNLSHKDDQSGRQVFCVTHLPQLAGYADAHMRVSKTVAKGRTRTIVEPVEGKARVAELAQMLGGESENTLKIARELLGQRAP